jgi:hypothetical protein
MKRQLGVGCKGGDVLAVQRALYGALRTRGGKATNTRSSSYGAKTVSDVKAFQKLAGLNQSGKVGLNTLLALWAKASGKHDAGAFDDYGVQLLYRCKLGNPTTLKPDELKVGSKGPHVKAAQRMLWRALGEQSVNARDGTYGSGVVKDMTRFQNRANWQDRNPKNIGQNDWVALWGFGDDRAKELARKTVVTPKEAIYQQIRSWGEWYVQNRGRISYAQVRKYPKNGALPVRTDCSGSSTHILFMGGCPNDPHGRGYDGYGYTGTCYQRGHRIALGGKLLPGDCVFYGNQGGGVPSHMVIVIGPGDRALTFGGNPPQFVHISSYWLTNRRNDLGARRYF